MRYASIQNRGWDMSDADAPGGDYDTYSILSSTFGSLAADQGQVGLQLSFMGCFGQNLSP